MKYPTVCEVSVMNMRTLLCFHRELSPPATDVERTVRKRIKKRIAKLHLETPAPCEPAFMDQLREMGIL